jgi:CHRD domain
MRLLLSAVAAIFGLAMLAGALSGHKVAEAARITIEGTATGAEENPPTTEGVTARVRLVWDDVTNDMTFAVTVNGISQDQITASHIHRGARGVNGPIIYPFSMEPFSQISGTVRINASDVADLRAGNLYFNIHSKTNPGGTARMQIILPASAAAPVAPAQAPVTTTTTTTIPVTPPSTGDAGLLGDTQSALMFFVGIVAMVLSGAGVLTLARKRA